MAVVEARIQTVEEIYQLLWTAVENKLTIEASYHGRPRLFCPHRLGRNREGQLRVPSAISTADSKGGLQPEGPPANWRCIELEKPCEVSRKCVVSLRRIIGALAHVYRKPISTPRIIASAIGRRDIETVVLATGSPTLCVAS